MSYFWTRISKISSSFVSGVILGLPIYITVNDYFFSVARVEGASMQPTLNPTGKKKSDFVFIDRWHTMPKDIRPGDVVALTSPNNHNVSFIKRVIGMEGDFLNTPRYKYNYVIVPKGHCWVEGDNHRSSLDSNKFGPISLGLVKGKATHVIWPPHRWARLHENIPENSPTEKITYPKKRVEQSGGKPNRMDVTIEIDTLDTTLDIDDESTTFTYNVEMVVPDCTNSGLTDSNDK